MGITRRVGLCSVVGLALIYCAAVAQAEDFELSSYYEDWDNADASQSPDAHDVYQTMSDRGTVASDFAAGGCGKCGQCGNCGSRGSCCDGGCCGNGCGFGCGCDPRLFGLIAQSDHAFDDFISPLSNIAFFEDPRTLTELRFIFLNHQVPGNAPVLGNSDVQLYAMQIRAALTKRLSIIANKDGYIDMHSDLYGHKKGWADMAAGLKYNVIRDPGTRTIVSLGTTFEADLGSHQVFQGRGDGEFRFFATGGQAFGLAHWLSETGFRIPTDHTQRSQMWYWANHWDYQVAPGWYGLLEVNWFHWLRSGNGPLGTSGFEGFDLFNLGSTGVAGNDIVSAAVGGRWKPKQNVIVGFGWEFPLTNRRDILHDRLYADLIIRY